MSDTPRTDAAIAPASRFHCEIVSADFARQLERELAEARRAGAFLVEGWEEAIEVSNNYYAKVCELEKELELLRQKVEEFSYKDKIIKEFVEQLIDTVK